MIHELGSMNKKREITEKQARYLKDLLCIWWDVPHDLKQYNESVKRVNKILHRGTYTIGSDDEKAIKQLMECVNMIT